MPIQLFTGVFLGVYLVIVGIVAVILSFTNLRISIFRLAVAVLLIYAGLFAAFGGHLEVDPETVLMSRVTADVTRSGEHSVVFGEGIFNVITPAEGEVINLEFNAVFGSTVVRIPRDVPVRVIASSAFGSVTTPDGTSTHFGEHTYSAGESPVIYIKASAVFGSLTVTR